MLPRNRYWTGNGPHVFVQLNLTGDGVTYRSELVNGVLELEKGSLTAFVQNKVEARLILTRQGFWEGPRTALPLSNGNGANNTSGLTIYRLWQRTTKLGAHQTARTPKGSLPAPLELQLTNTSGGTRYYSNFRIANNAYDTLLVPIGG